MFELHPYDIGLLLVGLIVLAAAVLPPLLARSPLVTAPLVFMLAGALVFLLPWAPELPDLVEDAWWPKRLTELGVIIALTSAGLKLNRPFAWETWRISWRLLAVTMPLTIAAAAWLGWWAAGLVPASAILLGAVIAPTDPVLASDVQTTPPDQPDSSRARLALTTEAGLNDGLAFPFTNLAIAIAVAGLAPSGWLGDWLLIDVLYKIGAGTVIGALAGYLLAKIIIDISATEESARTVTGILALSLTLVPYGLAELASSYGFIAVFVAACVFRQYECGHDYQMKLHNFSQEMEGGLVAVLMFLIGAYAVTGIFQHMTPTLWLVALAIIFVVRPAAGLIGLAGAGLPRGKRWAIAFFGIRGIGSIYYLAYAVFHAEFPGAMTVWALVLAVVIISVLIHGLSARLVMQWAISAGNKQGRW